MFKRTTLGSFNPRIQANTMSIFPPAPESKEETVEHVKAPAYKPKFIKPFPKTKKGKTNLEDLDE